MSTEEETSQEAFFAARNRAYELADSGRYKEWNAIAYALQAEGFLPALITRLDEDGLTVMMLSRACDIARS
jgi:hypothetical protein